MLCINKSCHTPLTLGLCYHMQGYCGFTRGLRTINLNNTTSRNTAYTQSNIQWQNTSRDNLHIHICCGISQAHNRPLAVVLFYLLHGIFQGFFSFLLHILKSPYCQTYFTNIITNKSFLGKNNFHYFCFLFYINIYKRTAPQTFLRKSEVLSLTRL